MIFYPDNCVEKRCFAKKVWEKIWFAKCGHNDCGLKRSLVQKKIWGPTVHFFVPQNNLWILVKNGWGPTAIFSTVEGNQWPGQMFSGPPIPSIGIGMVMLVLVWLSDRYQYWYHYE